MNGFEGYRRPGAPPEPAPMARGPIADPAPDPRSPGLLVDDDEAEDNVANVAIPLVIDRSELARFVNAMFAGLDPSGYVSLRAFPQRTSGKPLHIEAIRLNTGLNPVVDAAVRIAAKVCNGGEPGVFAPPVCTFADRKGAKGSDLFEAPALSLEIDAGDLERIADGLSLILGERPTIALHSGSTWTDPATGTALPKGHLHWKLRTPARGPEPLRLLRRARDIATLIAGGDPTGAPPVHPLRWPGTWNRKSADPPVMARIIEQNASTIDLAEALASLEDAAEAASLAVPKGAAHLAADDLAADDLPAELVQLAEWLTFHTTTHLRPANAGLWHDWNNVAMALYRATGGSEDGFKLFNAWSATAPQFYSEAGCRTRWDAITDCPPTWIGARWLRNKAIDDGWVLEPPKDWERAHPPVGDAAGSRGDRERPGAASGQPGPETETPKPDGAGAGDGPPQPPPDAQEQPGLSTPAGQGPDGEDEQPDPAWNSDAGPGGQTEPPPPQREDDDFILPIEFSENSLSYLFSSRHQHHLVYVHRWGKWLRYHAGRWHEDHTVRVYDAARAICAEQGECALHTLPPRSARKVAAVINKAGCVAAIERLARHHEPQTRDLDLFDADQALIGGPSRHGKLHRNRKK